MTTTMSADPSTKPRGDAMLRLIGASHLVKAAMLLLLGLALLRVLGNEARSDAIIDWIGRLRPGKLTDLVDLLVRKVLAMPVDRRLILVGGAWVYATLFTIEGTGLLLRKHWAKWVTVASTGLLIPFEIYELTVHLDVIRVGAFLVNGAILAYLIVQLRRDRTR